MDKQVITGRNDLKDFIVQEIERSGFTLEQYTINCLVKSGWTVYPGFHFFDRDGGCDRELDIFAEKEMFLEEHKLLLTAYLVIQCKKIPGNTWVFFSGPVSKTISGFSHSGNNLSLLDAFNLEFEGTYGHSIMDYNIGAAGFVSSSYTEIITDLSLTNKKTSNLFEAITSVLKSTRAPETIFLGDESAREKVDYIKSGKVLEWVSDDSPMNIAFILPVIIFEGKMFAAKFPLKKDNLKEIPFVSYYGEYHSEKYHIGADIDIVNKSILTKYLKAIESNLNNLAQSPIEEIQKAKQEISEKIVMKLKMNRLTENHEDQ